MGKFSNGPDWVDVLMYAKALDTLHGCLTGISIIRAMPNADYSVLIQIVSVWDVIPGAALLDSVTTERRLSASELSSLPAVIYGGMYSHDYAIGLAYQQRSFSEPARDPQESV